MDINGSIYHDLRKNSGRNAIHCLFSSERGMTTHPAAARMCDVNKTYGLERTGGMYERNREATRLS